MGPNLIIVNLPIRLVATSTVAGINLVLWDDAMIEKFRKVDTHLHGIYYRAYAI